MPAAAALKLQQQRRNSQFGQRIMTNFPSGDPLSDRRRALEDSFFMERDQHLLEKLRSQLSSFEERNKLSHVSGITEQHVLDHLVKAGVKAETLAAVQLIPLVEVAWCDGSVAAEERNAVLNAAAAQGIHPESASYSLLEQWLKNRPDVRVIAAWKEYVQELARLMPHTAPAMKKNLTDRLRRVAEAAGGFLGLSTISKTEHAAIEEFSRAWDV
jgi:hypothetical protein